MRGGRDPLRILVVVQFLPYPPQQGFALRVHYLVRELARHHRVTILAYDAPGHVGAARHYEAAGIEVRLVSLATLDTPGWARKLRALASRHSHRWHDRHRPAMQAALDAVLAERRHDLVQIESPEFWRYRYATSAPVYLDAHNIWYELRARAIDLRRGLIRQAYQRFDNAKARREEHAAWRRLDGCLVTSEREARVVRGKRARRVVVVPNGVDPGYLQPSEALAAPDALVFTGLMAYRPNSDAVRWFVADILPRILAERPDAHLTVVGKDVPRKVLELAGPSVTITGSVPDIRPHLGRAAVVIVPLRAGSGTRIKILEALSMGRAVVSTTVGAEGLEVRSGEHLVLADTAEDFARAVTRLLADPAETARLGSAGRQLIERSYAWARIAADLSRHYGSVVAVRAPDRP